MPVAPTYRAAPALTELGSEFFDAVVAARFPRHVLRYRNQRWAARVGLDTLDAGEWERHCASLRAAARQPRRAAGAALPRAPVSLEETESLRRVDPECLQHLAGQHLTHPALERQAAVTAARPGRLAAALGSQVEQAAVLRVAHLRGHEAAPAAEIGVVELSERLLARLGLAPRDPASDAELTRAVFGFLEESRVGYDQFFFDWYGGAASAHRVAAHPAARYAGARFDRLRGLLDAYAPRAPERLTLPYFQRAAPCTLIIDEIEALWAPIAERDDWSPFEAKLGAIAEARTALGLAAT